MNNKYGKRIVREAIDRFPYDKGANRKDLFMAIKGIKPNKERIKNQFNSIITCLRR